MLKSLTTTFPYVNAEKLLTGQINPDNFLNLLHQYSFVYLYNLDIPSVDLNAQRFKNLERSARHFFSLKQDEKMKYYIGRSPNHRGYVPLTEKGAYGDEKKRIYEAFDLSFHLHHPTSDDLKKLRGANIWPEEITSFKAVCESYYEKMFTFSKSIFKILAQAFGMQAHYFDELTKYPPSQLRLIRYLENDFVENDDVAMGGHTDYECFTLLHQTAPGIQGYLFKEGKFINLPCFKNTLLLLVGDMLHYMTNGYLKSFYHRVVSTGTERLSFPFFMNLDFETKISVLPKFKSYTSFINRQEILPKQLTVGHHLIGQLYRDFPYMKDKIDQGLMKLSFAIPKENIFEKQFIINHI